jgi:hypothetical protein
MCGPVKCATSTAAPRPPDPSLRNHRNRQRELALQKPHLSATPACPGGQTGTAHAGPRSVACEGTARRARGPPVRYRDKPAPMPVRGPYSMPIRGPDCMPFDRQDGVGEVWLGRDRLHNTCVFSPLPMMVTGPFRRVCETRRAQSGNFLAPPTHIRLHPIRSDRGSDRRRSRPPNAPCLSWCRGGAPHL